RAVADLSRAIELKAKGSWVWVARGAAYAQLGKWDKAAADYSQALGMKPQDEWEVWRARGWAHYELGQWDRAIADYSKAIELRPGDWRSWWWRGLAHARQGQHARAVPE